MPPWVRMSRAVHENVAIPIDDPTTAPAGIRGTPKATAAVGGESQAGNQPFDAPEGPAEPFGHLSLTQCGIRQERSQSRDLIGSWSETGRHWW